MTMTQLVDLGAALVGLVLAIVLAVLLEEASDHRRGLELEVSRIELATLTDWLA